MKSKPSMRGTILVSMAATAVLSIALLGALWLHSEYKAFESESAAMREEYVANQKALIKAHVDRSVAYILYRQELIEEQAKTFVRGRVHEAHAIASSIHQENKATRTPSEIQKLIRDALRPIRFHNGKGYYFAVSLNGVVELNADRPQLEGTNLLAIQGAHGEMVVKDMIDIVKEYGEGFYQYTWWKPNMYEKDFPKIAFVKLFEPYMWLIGAGEYLDDTEREIQEEVLDHVSRITFNGEGYIFAGRWDGTSLAGPSKGKNMWHVTDAHGLKVVQELVRLAKDGGGFLTYTVPEATGRRPAPKLSYVRGVSSWGWYVGAGAYIDKIEESIGKRHDEVKARIFEDTVKSVLLLLGLVVAACAAAARTSRKIGADFSAFASFFKRGTVESAEIDLSKMTFSEFENIAHLANEMIDGRCRAEDRLKASIQEKEVLLREIHHRVKNNMQIMSSLLQLRMGKTKDPDALEAFNDSRDRIKAMALVHEMLYQSGNMARIDLSVYATKLARYLWQAHGEICRRVALNMDCEPVSLPLDLAVPCGLVMNELISNALKHAFPGDATGHIRVSVRSNGEGHTEIAVGDDGVGLPAGTDPMKTGSLGLKLIKGIVEEQLDGQLEVNCSRGTEFRIKLGS